MMNDTHDLKKAQSLQNSLTDQMVVSIANAAFLSPTANTQYLSKVSLV